MKKKRSEDEEDLPPPPAFKHPFERYRDDIADERRIFDQARFEESRVAYVLRTVSPRNSKLWIARVRRAEERFSGEPRLTFRAFGVEFPSFPYLLGASWLDGIKLHTTSSAMLPAMFRSFKDVPFVRPFEQFYELAKPNARDRGVGLVFPRKGLRHGLVILDRFPETSGFRGLSLVYHGGDRKRESLLYVVLFQTLIETLHAKGHGWSPD